MPENDVVRIYEQIIGQKDDIRRLGDLISQVQLDVRSRQMTYERELAIFQATQHAVEKELEGLVDRLSESNQRVDRAVEGLRASYDRLSALVAELATKINTSVQITQTNQTDMGVGDIEKVTGDVFQGEKSTSEKATKIEPEHK